MISSQNYAGSRQKPYNMGKMIMFATWNKVWHKRCKYSNCLNMTVKLKMIKAQSKWVSSYHSSKHEDYSLLEYFAV
jgi:hypothetical protein